MGSGCTTWQGQLQERSGPRSGTKSMPNRSLRRHMSVVGSRTQRILPLPLPLQGQRCDYRSGVEVDEASEVAGQVYNNRRVWSLLYVSYRMGI
ncbi:hypothetical protein QR685DRAFT_449242 [Neurospora intermedia]|uniref:Questionable protein n=1 Tax=Neurospora intermedia TaxID=5142 RepID=A0ABR3D3P3_NEUIN